MRQRRIDWHLISVFLAESCRFMRGASTSCAAFNPMVQSWCWMSIGRFPMHPLAQACGLLLSSVAREQRSLSMMRHLTPWNASVWLPIPFPCQNQCYPGNHPTVLHQSILLRLRPSPARRGQLCRPTSRYYPHRCRPARAHRWVLHCSWLPSSAQRNQQASWYAERCIEGYEVVDVQSLRNDLLMHDS